MSKFNHLTYAQRKKIEEMCQSNASVKEIAEELGVCRSTIYNEFKRSGGKDKYSADSTQLRYQEFLECKGTPPKIIENEALRMWIRSKILNEGKTPLQIENELRELQNPELGVVTHQTIYAAILKGYIPDVYPDDSVNSIATIQKDGTLYIPQNFLRTHRLEHGQQFEISFNGEQIILTPLNG